MSTSERRAARTAARSSIRRAGFGALVAAVTLAACEGALRLIGWPAPRAEPDPFVSFRPTVPVFTPIPPDEPDAAGARRYETNPAKLPEGFVPDAFTLPKPPGTLRIVVLGGSSVVGGAPGGKPYAFPRQLEALFQRELEARGASSGRRVEVLNAGCPGYASYRIANLLPEMLGYDPDLVIVYEAHNEYLERHFYDAEIAVPEAAARAKLWGSRSYAYRALKSGLLAARRALVGAPAPRLEDRLLLGATVESRVDLKAVSPAELHARRDEIRARLEREDPAYLEHFTFAYASILEQCRAAGVRLLVLGVAANLLDPPTALPSIELTPARLDELAALLAQVRAAVERGELAAARAGVERAARIDAGHGGVVYWRGRIALAEGRRDEAEALLRRANALDVRRHRVQEPFRARLASLTEARGADYVDVDPVFRAADPATLGGSLFFDHVHPTPEGHLLIAETISRWLRDEGMLPEPARPGRS